MNYYLYKTQRCLDYNPLSDLVSTAWSDENAPCFHLKLRFPFKMSSNAAVETNQGSGFLRVLVYVSLQFPALSYQPLVTSW